MKEPSPKPNRTRTGRPFLFWLVAVVLLVDLFMVALALFSLQQSRLQYTEHAALQTQNLAQALEYSIAGIMAKSDLTLLSIVDEVQREQAAGGIDGPTLNAFIARQHARLPEFDSIRMADAQGEVKYGIGVVTGAAVSGADRDYFIELRRNANAGLVLSKPVIGRISGKWVLILARRVNNPDGSFAGVVYGPIALERFMKLFAAFELGPSGAIGLRDGDMSIIVRYPEPKEIGSMVGKKMMSPELRQRIQAGNRIGTFFTPTSWDNVAKLVSFRRLADYPLYITVVQAERDYLEPWLREVVKMSTLVTLFICVTLILSRLVFLRRRREKVAEAALRSAKEELERRVEERTCELFLANAQLTTELAERERAEQGLRLHLAERKLVEESRNKALALIESLLASSPTCILVYEGESGDCVMANEASANLVGGSIAELRLQNFRKIASWQLAGLDQVAETVLSDGVTRQMEKSFRTSFGKTVQFACFLSRFEADQVPHLMFMALDISENKRLEQENRLIEAQMLHVQKLESLGVLAGGIAHDFNNILMVVLGNADLALRRLPKESPAREHLAQIEQAAGRAADLARQMLAYSGKGRFVIENLDLTGVVEEMAHMLEVSISKKVALRYHFSADLPAVSADATQLRQVILNLVINASEAIGDQSGVIAISTGAMACDRAYLGESWVDDRLPEGLYVTLEVADSGCGMDRDIVAKIFDPFFTTKFTGRGLGMAAVLGIVRGHKGAIKVYSEKGKGSTFKLLLPAVTDSVEPQQCSPPLQGAWRGAGTVLLVDDEETIRALCQGMLEAIGFQVLTASDGKEALELFARSREEIVCVLLDLTMPRLDGEQTFRELRRLNPEVRVIISSGYNEQEVSQKFVGKGLAGFLQKPYKMAELSGKLKEILEGSRG